jgi:hypothetical protein
MSSYGGDGGYRPGVGDMPGGWFVFYAYPITYSTSEFDHVVIIVYF